MFTSVLVPLDLGEDADRALPVAAALAKRLAIPLDVVIVGSRGIAPGLDDDEARRHAQAVGVDIDDVLIRYDSDVAGGVLSQVASFDGVLCVATHARGPLADLWLRSLSGQLARRSPDAFVLVGPDVVVEPRPRFTDVVAGIDAAPASAPVAAATLAWARLLDVKAHLVQVVHDDAPADASASAAARIDVTLQAMDVTAAWQVVRDDDPARGLLAAADQHDSPLVVIGTHDHAHTFGPRPALGSVAHEVVRRSHHPVLVVPPAP
jgi:nucleotide-binding universal stress UspA family protein